MVWWHGRCVLTSGGGRRITVHAVSWAEGADVLWGLRLCSDGPGAAWPPHTRQHTTTSTPTENDKSNNNDEEVRVWACFAGCHRHAGAGGGEVIEANRDIQVPSTRPTWADSVLSRLTQEFLNIVLAFINSCVGGSTHWLKSGDFGDYLLRRDGVQSLLRTWVFMGVKFA